jgi:hypothetical protein
MFLLLLLVICLAIFGLIVSKNPIFISRIATTIVLSIGLLLLVSYLSFTLKNRLSSENGAVYAEAMERLSAKYNAAPSQEAAK